MKDTHAQPAGSLHQPSVCKNPARQPGELNGITRVFVNRDRLAFLWFWVAAGAVAFACAQPYFLIRSLKERERVVIIDPAGTAYLSPLMNFQEAKEFHAQQSILASTAFLERNPKGLDHPDLLKQVFLREAFNKALKQVGTEAEELKAKQLHQKVEIAKIDVLETREDLVLTQVSGQLVRTGLFEQRLFVESIPFTLSLKLKRNPDMSKNGRFPTAVSDFKYETSR
jgi:hypothetical protein